MLKHWRLIIFKMLIFPQLSCSASPKPWKSQEILAVKLDELIQKFLWQFKGPRIAKAVLAKKAGELALLVLRLIIECNGNPLQYSCLENPRDRGAWWAAFYGVAQSGTPLKRLSSSSSNTWPHSPLPQLLLAMCFQCRGYPWSRN